MDRKIIQICMYGDTMIVLDVDGQIWRATHIETNIPYWERVQGLPEVSMAELQEMGLRNQQRSGFGMKPGEGM